MGSEGECNEESIQYDVMGIVFSRGARLRLINWTRCGLNQARRDELKCFEPVRRFVLSGFSCPASGAAVPRCRRQEEVVGSVQRPLP